MKRTQHILSHAQLTRWLQTHKIAGGADTTALNAAVADLATEVTNTTGIEASAALRVSFQPLVEGWLTFDRRGKGIVSSEHRN